MRLGDVARMDEREVQSRILREDQQYQRTVSYEFRGPNKLGDMYRDAILEATRTDKKARGGAVRYSLLRSIGTPARGDDGGWTVGVGVDYRREPAPPTTPTPCNTPPPPPTTMP